MISGKDVEVIAVKDTFAQLSDGDNAPVSKNEDYGTDNYISILQDLSVKLDEYFVSPKLAIYERQEGRLK